MRTALLAAAAALALAAPLGAAVTAVPDGWLVLASVDAAGVLAWRVAGEPAPDHTASCGGRAPLVVECGTGDHYGSDDLRMTFHLGCTLSPDRLCFEGEVASTAEGLLGALTVRCSQLGLAGVVRIACGSEGQAFAGPLTHACRAGSGAVGLSAAEVPIPVPVGDWTCSVRHG